MMIFKPSTLLIFFICITTRLLGQSTIKKLSPDKRNMPKNWEVYLDKIPVGGEVQVGMMAYEAPEKVKPISFFVQLPTHSQSELCVEINSRDGRYQAKLTYTIVGFSEGIYELNLPTQYQEELKTYDIKDIAIIAKIVRNDCDEDSEGYVLSAWNKPLFNKRQAFIYLNSQQPVFIVMNSFTDTQNERQIECKRINEPFNIAYNCRCDLSGYDLTKFKSITIKRIITRGSTRSYNSFDLPIRF